MIELLKLFSFDSWFSSFPDTFRLMNDMISNINWLEIMKIALFISLACGLTIGLLIANDKVFHHYNEKRIKKHHLTIRNNGNVPSIFLLRTVDLPKHLAVRFRVDDLPMIWVSRKEAAKPQPENAVTDVQEQRPGRSAVSETALVPDLQDPFSAVTDTAGKTVKSTRKAVTDVGRKAGLFAGIISSVTNLFGVKAPGLQEAQSTLKNVQQQSNQTIQSINSKLGTADTLANQVGSVLPKDGLSNAAKGAVSGLQQGGSVSGMSGAEFMARDAIGLTQSSGARDLTFDEDIWRRNIGKVDEEGGELNYAMSKTLQPGESMQIDVDLMNLSASSSPVSLMYKIEVLQIPQTQLPLAAPREYITGIVIYPRISLWSRIVPSALMIALVVVSLQLLAGYSHLVF